MSDELKEAYAKGVESVLKKYDKRQAAGYALLHALLHDPAFDNLRTSNQLTAQTVKALSKAKKAYL